MSRATALASVIAACLTAVVPALADDPPDPARIKRAAEEFDLGVAAFKAKNFDEAAQHFEAADEAVPGGKALRLAIRARSEAGQEARAASLAALAIDRYPGDADTMTVAKETIDREGQKLHRVNVSCASPCVLAVGTRTVHGARATRWIVYLNPGKTTMNASFLDETSGKARSIEAKAGGSTDVRFEPSEKPKPAGTATATATVAPTATASEGPAPPPPAKGIHPAFFGVGAALTLAAGGVLAWSGVDTLQNPGADKVREACAGKGPECPEYKLGLENQLRTNILIGATAGTAAVTVLLAIFTRWSGQPAPSKTAIVPTASFHDRGASFGVQGAFE